MDAVVCSIPTTYARSPLAPAARTSYSADMQFEKVDASQSNVGRISSHPVFVVTAPNNVTGSSCDHIAARGLASPLWSAVSAVFKRGIVDDKNASNSSTASTSILLIQDSQIDMFNDSGQRRALIPHNAGCSAAVNARYRGRMWFESTAPHHGFEQSPLSSVDGETADRRTEPE